MWMWTQKPGIAEKIGKEVSPGGYSYNKVSNLVNSSSWSKTVWWQNSDTLYKMSFESYFFVV